MVIPTLSELVKLYESGLSQQQIGDQIGRSKKWVNKRLSGHIIPRKAKRRPVNHARLIYDKKDKNRLVIELYSAGDGTHLIAKKMGMHKRTVSVILKSNGITIRGRLNSTIDKKEVNKLYASGQSAHDIAMKFGVTTDAVLYHLKDTRKASEALLKISLPDRPKIIAMAHEGCYRIAEHFGYHPEVIRRFLKRKGLSVKAFSDEWKSLVQRNIKTTASRLEKKFQSLMNDAGIVVTPQASIGEFRFDFETHGILVDLQGSYWHSTYQRRARDMAKAKAARKLGRKVIIIWDFEFNHPDLVLMKIKNAINPPKIALNKLAFRKIPSVVGRLMAEKYHVQGSGRAGDHFGAYLDDELIAMVSMTSVSRQEIAKAQGLDPKQMRELHRLIIHPQYQARNLASWLIGKVVKVMRRDGYKRLVSFCDPTFGHDGSIYKASNWHLDGKTSGSYWYVKKSTGGLTKIINKKTIWNAAKSADMSENEYAKYKNLIKVHGHPKLRFTYDL